MCRGVTTSINYHDSITRGYAPPRGERTEVRAADDPSISFTEVSELLHTLTVEWMDDGWTIYGWTPTAAPPARTERASTSESAREAGTSPVRLSASLSVSRKATREALLQAAALQPAGYHGRLQPAGPLEVSTKQHPASMPSR